LVSRFEVLKICAVLRHFCAVCLRSYLFLILVLSYLFTMFFENETKDKRNVNLRGNSKTESKKNFVQRVEQERLQRQLEKQKLHGAGEHYLGFRLNSSKNTICLA
jgi:competence protein ComGC